MDSARAAVLRPDETEFPLLVAVGRRARHPGRLGATGRLGPELAPPGQELGVGEGRPVGDLIADGAGGAPPCQRVGRTQDDGVRTVGQVQCHHGHPRGCAGGGHRLQGAGEHQERVGRAALPDARRQVIDHHRATQTQLLDQPGDGSPVHAGHHQAPDVSGLQTGGFQGSGQGILAQSQVEVLAEPLFPQLGGAVARRPPTVGEFVGGRGGGQQLGQYSGPLSHERGGPGVAAGGLVGTSGKSVPQVPGDHQVDAAAAECGN